MRVLWKIPQKHTLCAECIYLHYKIISSMTDLYDKETKAHKKDIKPVKLKEKLLCLPFVVLAVAFLI